VDVHLQDSFGGLKLLEGQKLCGLKLKITDARYQAYLFIIVLR
jgi:hypothetical protein